MKEAKIRIVFGMNDFLIGGIQRQFAEQVKFFDKEKFEVILITLFQFEQYPDLYAELPAGLEIHKLNFSGVRDVKNWWRLYRLLKRLDPDIVVSSLFFSNTLLRLLKPLVGYACIVSEQNTYTGKSWRHRCIDYMLALVTFRIIASSRTVATFTSRHVHIPERKFVVIHNGVNVSCIEEELRHLPPVTGLKEELGFNASDKLVINVARLMEQKNQELLIRAFADFSTRHPAYKLIILGYGPLKERLEALVEELGMTGTILLLGAKNPVVPYYAASDFFVLTSRIEGFALVGIEAMACGLPVVSTRTAGPDEYVHEGENGFFIDADTPQSVVQAMEKVLVADRQQLSRNASSTAQEYDVRANVRKYEDLFWKCLEKTSHLLPQEV